MNSIRLTIEFPSEDELETIKRILDLEISQNVSERAKVFLKNNGQKLEMRIESEDVVALRAFYNSMMRLLRSSVRIREEIIEKD